MGQFSERDARLGGEIISDSAVQLLRLIHDDLRTLAERQEEADRRLTSHIAAEEQQIMAFMEAFPDGPIEHRHAHEAMIKAAEAQERFWNDLRIDVAKKGIWGAIVIVCGLVIAGAAAKFGVVVRP